MAIPSIKVTLDTRQSRISRDRIATLINAKYWGKRFISNGYIDPITNTALLCPAPRLPNWNTTGTGIYNRLKKSDYTLTSAKWVDANDRFTGDTYLKGIDPSGNPGEAVFTKVQQPRNGGMYLQWHAANSAADDWVQMECGWSNGTTADSVLSLRFFSSGEVEVYENQVYQQSYTLSGNDGVPQQIASTFTDVCIIPFRKKELLLFSNRGGGFSHVIESIDESVDDPTILAPLKFWWYVPQGAAQVQCAPIQYPTSGYVTGVKSFFRDAPAVSEVATSFVYGDLNGGGAVATLTDPDNPATAFIPNGTNKVARVKVALTGNGISSPNIYGVHSFFPTQNDYTNSTQSLELLPYVTKASLDVPDSPGDLRLTLELKKPQELNDTGSGSKQLKYISNRPIKIIVDSQPARDLIDGLTDAPSYVRKIDDTTDRITIECRDRWKIFEHYMFSDPVPLDGMNLSEAFKFLLKTAGLAISEYDVDAIAFMLPTVQDPKQGEFSVLIEVGDTIADWLTKLKETFYATLFIGFVPRADGIKFVVKKPESLPTVASIILYKTVADAKAYLAGFGANDKLFPRYEFRTYSQHVLEPEANDIWVSGVDLRTGRPIVSHKVDSASQDPTLAPNARPANWLGEIRKYGLVEPDITTQAACNQATYKLFDKLTPVRTIAEFDSDMLFKSDGSPVWRGDAIWLDTIGGFRVTSLSIEFRREPNTTNEWYWRPSKYTCQFDSNITQPSPPTPSPAP